MLQNLFQIVITVCIVYILFGYFNFSQDFRVFDFQFILCCHVDLP